MSVLRINSNPVALNAVRNLKATGMALSRSMERMSSGLRINRAADDAAGLSISEKLRSQIRGLSRASMNALDGISLIQTAEGALSEIHTILHRMRELAVQASNGVNTADDRLAIQDEVNQLVDEINRISSSTEFNTKKLLDGTLAALVSTDDYQNTKASVVGDVGQGGNFVLKAAVLDAGQLQVQKSDVFNTTLEKDAVGMMNYLHTLRGDVDITGLGASGVGKTGIGEIQIRNNPLVPNAVLDDWENPGTITVGNAFLAGNGHNVLENFQNHQVTRGEDKLVYYTWDETNGTLAHSIVLDNANTVAWNLLNGDIQSEMNINSGGVLAANINFMNGQQQVQLAGNAQLVAVEFVDADQSGSEFYISFDSGPGGLYSSNVFTRRVDISFANNNSNTGMIPQTAAAGNSTITLGNFATTGQVDVRFDVRYDWNPVINVVDGGLGEDRTDVIEFDLYSGANSLQDSAVIYQDGAIAQNGTFLVSAIGEQDFAVYEFDNVVYTSLMASGIDKQLAISQARGAVVLDSSGSATHTTTSIFTGQVGGPLENVYVGFEGILQGGETATFNISTNNVLTGDQLNTLASLNRFQEFGVFNGSNSVDLTLYVRGMGSGVTIQLNRNDTFEDMASKISLAMYNPDGNDLFDTDIIANEEWPDLVHINTIGNAKGTMSITTPIPGAELVFAGEEGLLKALSLVEVREGIAPTISINAYNLELGKSIGDLVTTDNQIRGLIDGVDLRFDNTKGMRLDPEPPLEAEGGANLGRKWLFPQPIERPEISVTTGYNDIFVHVAPQDFDLQIGANEGQTLKSVIASMDAESLGVEGLLVVSESLAQRAVSVVDRAISKVSEQRSQLGAIQNRLEATIRNLDVAAENLTASESRIRDVDLASTTVLMTQSQILMQSGVAALAQANQMSESVLQLLR